MNSHIELRSDNAAGVAPEIIAAISGANTGSALAYGDDDWTVQLRDKVREVFEHPQAEVFPVISGTAANSIALAALCPPWGSVLCHQTAHVLQSECGATSMFGAGAVMRGVAGEGFRIGVDALHAAFEATRWGDPHHSQPSVLSLTEPSDHGTLYTVQQVTDVVTVARERGLRAHLDGARIANAVAALGCSPGDLTWRAGIDAFSLGATKNGVLSTDAIVCFDPDVSAQLVYRVKRAGHVASKMRFQSVQLTTYLTDGLWLRLAAHSNAAMTRLADGLRGLGIELLNEPDVNMVFARVEPAVADRMADEGLLFYRISNDTIRLVTSFQTTDDEIDDALSRTKTALAA
ncbi:MAG TPA: beta-eliminating lyase-related protein [Ilumatobacteraceae bacterium]|nr:beta-eliminating lyase-related protein [Ilumatobacteraceae bacterium]